MSTVDHPYTDGQTERVNCVVEAIIGSVCAITPGRWSSMLPVFVLALNNAVHASKGDTPFYGNGLTAHTRVSLKLPRSGSGLGGGEITDLLADVSPATVQKQVSAFLTTRLNVLRYARDAMADSQYKQKINQML